MDIDLEAPGLAHIIGRDAPMDRIAHGLTFGEGPVWDRRTGQLYWVDIIGNTIWKWKPGGSQEVVMRPSGHANGMTYDRDGRIVDDAVDYHVRHFGRDRNRVCRHLCNLPRQLIATVQCFLALVDAHRMKFHGFPFRAVSAARPR